MIDLLRQPASYLQAPAALVAALLFFAMAAALLALARTRVRERLHRALLDAERRYRQATPAMGAGTALLARVRALAARDEAAAARVLAGWILAEVPPAASRDAAAGPAPVAGDVRTHARS